MNPLIIIFNVGFALFAAYAVLLGFEEAYNPFQYGQYAELILVDLPIIAGGAFFCLVGLAAAKANLDGEDF